MKRYISRPSAENIVEVQNWITEAMKECDYGQDLDLAVDCCHDLNIFCEEERSDQAIPEWIMELATKAFEPD